MFSPHGKFTWSMISLGRSCGDTLFRDISPWSNKDNHRYIPYCYHKQDTATESSKWATKQWSQVQRPQGHRYERPNPHHTSQSSAGCDACDSYGPLAHQHEADKYGLIDILPFHHGQFSVIVTYTKSSSYDLILCDCFSFKNCKQVLSLFGVVIFWSNLELILASISS